ncbi:MAG: tetratricopeptide repeat protein [Candidatus Latescibacterota bacterium]|nr:tetratricopeptide repeat protein [Candidatus Latescibacterota bacterium]
MRRVMAVMLWLWVLLCAGPSAAQSAALGLYQEGNQLYRDGGFEVARERYLAAVDAGGEDVRLYYNLGNAAFKSGRTGEAVVWYERARRLSPRDTDIVANLRFVQRIKRDRETAVQGGVGDWLWQLYLWPTLNEIAVLFNAGLFFLFALAVWRLWYGSGTRYWIICGCLLTIQAAVTSTGANRLHRHFTLVEAVVTVERGTARSGPDAAQTTVFVVHEGTKVTVERQEEGWFLVRLANGLGGWLQDADVTVI